MGKTIKSYTKENQLKKIKEKNPAKMSKTEYEQKCAWLQYEYPMCQVCNLVQAQDMHHSKFGNNGADRDDRTIIPVCRKCHEPYHSSGEIKIPTEQLILYGFALHNEWLRQRQ